MGSFQNPLLQLTASAMMFIPLLTACGGGGGFLGEMRGTAGGYEGGGGDGGGGDGGGLEGGGF